jgi:hypothetical protein
MNQTNFTHAGIAAALCLLVVGLSGNILAGALFAIGVFVGREHAQREYKLGDPSKLNGYEALDIWRWSLDAKLDLLFPVIAVSLVSLVLWFVM